MTLTMDVVDGDGCCEDDGLLIRCEPKGFNPSKTAPSIADVLRSPFTLSGYQPAADGSESGRSMADWPTEFEE